MGKSVSDYLKIAWSVFGKKAVNRMASEKAASFVGDICSKYQVAPKYSGELTSRIRNLISYMVNCELDGTPIDNKYISTQIQGPIARSLGQAASSSNNFDNMLADLINWLEDDYLDDIEKCLIEIGHKESSDYIRQFRDMFAEVKRRKSPEVIDVDAEEVQQYDSYELLPERQNKRSMDTYKNESDNDDDYINNLASSIRNELLSASKGKPGPAQMLELTKFFVDKSADVAKFCEEQKTKRTAIRANAQVAIHQIDSMRMFLQDYLDKTFDERRMLFAKEFEIVDKCLEKGDVQALAVSLNSITNLATSSPFKALADIKGVRNAIENHSTFDI